MNKEKTKTKNKLVKILNDNGYIGLEWEKFAENLAKNSKEISSVLEKLNTLAKKRGL
jgi:DNA-directed RNA polymerase specialized sigma54-like protein